MAADQVDLLIAATDRRLKQRAVAKGLAMVGVCGFWTWLALWRNVLAAPLLTEFIWFAAWWASMALALHVVGMIMPLPKGALGETVVRRRMDTVQRNLSRLYVFRALMTVFMAVCAGKWAWDIAQGVAAPYEFIALGCVAIGFLYELCLITGKGFHRNARLIFDDEVFKSFREGGFRVGYWVMMMAVSANLLLGLWRADLAVAALPVVLAIGVAVPALWIARSNRRAERGD